MAAARAWRSGVRGVVAAALLILVGACGGDSSSPVASSITEPTGTVAPLLVQASTETTTSDASVATVATTRASTPEAITVPASTTPPISPTVESAVRALPDLLMLSLHDAAFPLKVAPNDRHLVDQEGRPFFISGDSPWSLFVQLETQEIERYLDQRRGQGFNALLVELIEDHFSDDPPANAYGEQPFTTTNDFSTPNPAYFDRVHEIIRLAGARGFAVFVTPAFLGFNGGDEGWYQAMADNGPEVMRAYGRFLGERFADLPNIVWVHGGDYTPPPEGLELVGAINQGIVQGGGRQLRTVHWSRGTSGSDVDVDFLDIDSTYTDQIVHVNSLRDDERGGRPHFLLEARYEGEAPEYNARMMRSQAYQAILTGGAGHFYGQGDVWRFNEKWQDRMDTAGSRSMGWVRALFESLPWTDLRPDFDQRFVVDGRGSFGTEDFAPAAVTEDGAWAVVYVPQMRPITVDARLLRAQPQAWFYDPTNGVLHEVAAHVEADRLRLEPPGPNAAGDGDWVVIFAV